jgi:hypothetical protein
MGKRFSLAGKTLRSLVRGDFKAAAGGLRGLGRSFGAFGLAAGAAFGGLVSSIGIAGYTLKRWVGQYVAWGKQQGKLTRLTGIQGQAVARLTTQWRLSGLEIEKATKGTTLFSRKVYDAAKGSKTAARAFEDLGVKVTDADGRLRPTGAILSDVRARFSELEPGIRRTALAQQLFGKSGADLLPWLTKTSDEIEHYNELLKKSGLSWGPNAQKNLKEFIGRQREMSFMWDALKLRISQKVVPWLVEHMDDIEEGFAKIRKGIDRAFDWFEKSGPAIAEVAGDLASGLKFAAKHAQELAAAFVILQGIKLTGGIWKFFGRGGGGKPTGGPVATGGKPSGGGNGVGGWLKNLLPGAGFAGYAAGGLILAGAIGAKVGPWQAPGGAGQKSGNLLGRMGAAGTAQPLKVDTRAANAAIEGVGARWRKVAGITPKINADNRPSLKSVTTVATKIGAIGGLKPKVNVSVTDNGQAQQLKSNIAELFAREIVQNVRLSGGPIGAPVHPQARGGDWYVSRPTLFLAGEAGPERATFTPLSKAGRGAGAVLQVIFDGCNFGYDPDEVGAAVMDAGHQMGIAGARA